MMEQFVLKLKKEHQRPIVTLQNWHGFNALIDTGASFPVWTASETILENLGAKIIQKDVTFGGFGGDTKGNLYKLPKVVIGKLIFPEMAIISCSDLRNVPFHIILSATMFRNLIYEINDKIHCMTVTIPDDESCIRNLVIQDQDGKLHILINGR